MIVERKSTRAEMEADCATFDNLMANLSEDDYVSEDAAFGIGGERDMELLEELAIPLQEYLQLNYNPQCSIVISFDGVEIVNTICFIPLKENDTFRMKRLRRKCPKSAISNM